VVRGVAAAVPVLAAIVLNAHISPTDVVLLAVCAVLVVLGSRYPLPVSLGQSVVMCLSLYLGTSSATFTQLAAGFALGEVAHRHRHVAALITAWLGNAAATAVFLATGPLEPPPTAIRLLLATGMPVAAGLYLRARGRERQQAVELARAEERLAVARELHDLVAHHMSSIMLRVGVARHLRDGTDVLDEVHATSAAALEDLRRLLVVLRDPTVAPVAAPDFEPALHELRQRCEDAGTPVELHVRVGHLDAVLRHAVLRVVQESLTNALRHGRGPVRVEIDQADEVTVVVRNPVDRVSVREGFGLTGLRERVELLGGRLTAGPYDGEWLVRAALPVEGKT
jgi:signal transduction histidine kinase